MHAVVFEVDMKDGWEATVDEELDYITQSLKEVPGFVRGTWTTDGSVGFSLVLFESEDTAKEIADSASMPPESGATLRSARVLEVVREA